MTPAEIREARRKLGLTQQQFADMLETDAREMRRYTNPDEARHRPLSLPRQRLLRAYLDGYRPKDWPEKTRKSAQDA